MSTPLNIPRRYIWVAAGAAVAGAAMYLRNRFAKDEHDEFYDARAKDKPSASKAKAAPADKADTKAEKSEKPEAGGAEGEEPKTGDEDSPQADDDRAASARELAEFLSGDSWYDEAGWRSIWEREGIEDATAWLKDEGQTVLTKERESLSDHPALLAGCRRRWIVVCRYAGIDVSDAAALWNKTDGQ